MPIFGQVWLWSSLAFLLGAVLCWLLVARPARNRVGELEAQLATRTRRPMAPERPEPVSPVEDSLAPGLNGRDDRTRSYGLLDTPPPLPPERDRLAPYDQAPSREYPPQETFPAGLSAPPEVPDTELADQPRAAAATQYLDVSSGSLSAPPEVPQMSPPPSDRGWFDDELEGDAANQAPEEQPAVPRNRHHLVEPAPGEPFDPRLIDDVDEDTSISSALDASDDEPRSAVEDESGGTVFTQRTQPIPGELIRQIDEAGKEERARAEADDAAADNLVDDLAEDDTDRRDRTVEAEAVAPPGAYTEPGRGRADSGSSFAEPGPGRTESGSFTAPGAEPGPSFTEPGHGLGEPGAAFTSPGGESGRSFEASGHGLAESGAAFSPSGAESGRSFGDSDHGLAESGAGFSPSGAEPGRSFEESDHGRESGAAYTTSGAESGPSFGEPGHGLAGSGAGFSSSDAESGRSFTESGHGLAESGPSFTESGRGRTERAPEFAEPGAEPAAAFTESPAESTPTFTEPERSDRVFAEPESSDRFFTEPEPSGRAFTEPESSDRFFTEPQPSGPVFTEPEREPAAAFAEPERQEPEQGAQPQEQTEIVSTVVPEEKPATRTANDLPKRVPQQNRMPSAGSVSVRVEPTPSALPKRVPSKPRHQVPFGVQPSSAPEPAPVAAATAEQPEPQRSLFEPVIPAEGDGMVTPPPPHRLRQGSGGGRGPFGPGSAMPLPGGASPSPEFTIKASVAALRYCTPESPQFGRTVAEVWFRTAADAERVGFRPVG